MTDTGITKLESVLAGIRGYLTDQLGVLDLELHTAKKAVVELNQELASRQALVESLTASRDLLVSKLAELDDTASDAAPVAKPRASRKAAGGAVPQETAVVVTEAVVTEAVAEAPSDSGTAKKRSNTQGEVVAYLRSTPGVHKVAEIATAVSGSGSGAAVVQGIRRALAGLVQVGHVEKSLQSGTAFYSATADAPAVSTEVKAKATRKKAAPRPTKNSAPEAETAAPSVDDASASATPAVTGKPTRATRKAKTSAKKPAVVKAVTKKRVAKTAQAATPAPKAAVSVPAEKAVRADRAKIVAVLQSAAQPQSAAEVSRTVMGTEWKSSDATNFRNVLKSLAKEGAVVVVEGEKNRSHYTAAPAS